jgi:release factor glutamine methyltransferase
MTVSIEGALANARNALNEAGIDQARMDASLLLADLLRRDRAFLIAHANEALTKTQQQEFEARVSRRAGGEPLQYITGHQEFFQLDFEVTTDVLIPRPETELIVEAALEFAAGNAIKFADVGTGSGCIAISLLNELPNARAVAVDLSPVALQVAKRNAIRHHVIDRLRLIESDGFSAVPPDETFDLIVSNPPYVSDAGMKTLPREVRHEPAGALAGGVDGFAVIRELLADAPHFLRSGALFIFEIGFDQGEMVGQLIDQQHWVLIEIRRDLAGIPRTVILRRK